MKKFIISIMLMAMALPSFAAKRYQLPDFTVCNKSNCDIVLDGNGYLTEGNSGKRLLSAPVERSVFNSYSLFHIRGNYILELTSSRNWSIIVFSYEDYITRVTRYISLERGFSPESTQWSGMECRGDAILSSKYSPFESANNVLCSKNAKSQFIKPKNSEALRVTKNKGLVVELPVFIRANPQKNHSTYFFMDSAAPDAGALLCLSECGDGEDENRQLNFGGWIGKSNWVDMSLRDDHNNNNRTGTYFYLSQDIPIEVDGWIKNGSLALNEYRPSTHGRVGMAAMFGNQFGDSFLGTWSFFKAERISELFLAHRIY